MLYGVRTGVILTVLFVLFIFNANAAGQAEGDSRFAAARDHPINLKSPSELIPSTPSAAPSLSPSPSAVELNNLGVKYVKENRYEDAEAAFRKAVETDPNRVAVYLNLSVALDGMKRPADALAAAERAMELESGNIAAVSQVCQLRQITGKNIEAIACYERLNGLSEMDEYMLYGYGSALMEVSEFEKALSAFERSVRIAPNFLPAYCGTGLAYYHQKHYKEAAKAFRRGMEIDPDNAELRYNLAMAELGNRNRPAAFSQYSFLKESSPKLAERLYRALFADKVVFVGNR